MRPPGSIEINDDLCAWRATARSWLPLHAETTVGGSRHLAEGPTGLWASAAVANQIRGITELLDVDFDDPDRRLALQLACRARLLG